MAEQLDLETFTGAHPTNREFVEQLRAWGFTERKADGVHVVFRGPHGGTVRVLRTLLGRVDAGLVAKAARLVQVGVAQFWAGPTAAANLGAATGRPTPRRPAPRDQIVSLVLAVHVEADRPLGFDQVVKLCPAGITRDQVRTASSVLCRGGQLDRIRSGVYQWAGGARARQPVPDQGRPEARPPVPAPTPPSDKGQPGRRPSAELFDQLFPHGVRMTAELLADFERWSQLTEKLATHAEAS